MRFLILLLALPAALVFANPNENGDVQLWLNTATEKTPWILATEFRYGDRMRRLIHSHLQLEYQFEVCSWLNIYPGYRESIVLKDPEWVSRHEPLITALFHREKNGCHLSFRSRVQFIHEESATHGNHVVFRERFAITFKKEGLFRPYIEEELFFRKRDIYFQNRISLGVKYLPDEHAIVSFYSMLRWTRPQTYHYIFGLKGGYVF